MADIAAAAAKVARHLEEGATPMSGTESIAPGVSVVVPVLGRVPSTERMLASLRAAAERCPEPVEIILIDDSGPTDAARHREHCDRHGARYLRGPRHVGAKRNLGVRHASHDLLLFTDSDCRATPDLLRIHVEAIRKCTGDGRARRADNRRGQPHQGLQDHAPVPPAPRRPGAPSARRPARMGDHIEPAGPQGRVRRRSADS